MAGQAGQASTPLRRLVLWVAVQSLVVGVVVRVVATARSLQWWRVALAAGPASMWLVAAGQWARMARLLRRAVQVRQGIRGEAEQAEAEAAPRSRQPLAAQQAEPEGGAVVAVVAAAAE